MAHVFPSGSELKRKIDKRIMAFQHTYQRIMLSDLAQALPDHTWPKLFGAIGRSSQQHHAELGARQWDGEVNFLSDTSRTPSVSPPLHQGDQGGHDEKTYV